jgi:hypothetical protein
VGHASIASFSGIGRDLKINHEAGFLTAHTEQHRVGRRSIKALELGRRTGSDEFDLRP